MILRTTTPTADGPVDLDCEVNGRHTVLELRREEIERDEVELVQIDIVDQHGQTGRFWIDLRLSQKGAPVITVTTKTHDGKDLKKVQSGFWKKLKRS